MLSLMAMDVRVYLADLRHDFSGLLANDCMPLGVSYIKAVMDRARASIPERIGEHPVVAVSDLLAGVRRRPDGTETGIALPTSDVIVLELEGGHRVIMRPSGTEPKLKLYFYLRQPPDTGSRDEPGDRPGGSAFEKLVDAFLPFVKGMIA